jgi:hypothetical protein
LVPIFLQSSLCNCSDALLGIDVRSAFGGTSGSHWIIDTESMNDRRCTFGGNAWKILGAQPVSASADSS